MPIHLYSGPLSLFSRKVEIALAEKGLAYERTMVPFTQAAGYAPKHPAVVAANPKSQVPVLVDGELTVFDSTVIFEYLEDAYPAPPLFPDGPAARARCRLLELTADEILLPWVRPLMRRTAPDPDPERRRQHAEEAGQAETMLRQHYDRLEQALGADAYFCDRFSVADIALFMMLLWVQRLKGPGLGGHQALSRWYARVGERSGPAKAAAEIAAADRALSPPL
jgi:glutathione S-transferase